MSSKFIKKTFNKNYFIKRKKTFLLIGPFVIATVPILSSVSLSQNFSTLNQYFGPYSFGDKFFASYGDLVDYVDKNSKVINLEGNNSKWTATINGVTRTFNDPNELRQTLLENLVKVKQVKTDVDLSKYAGPNGILGLTNQEVWKHITPVSNEKNIVYQGNNDQTYTNQEDAYKSYFHTKEGYIFNGITFSDKTSLKNYLERDYFPNRQNTNNTVVITSPNGKSLPIDLTKQNAQELLNNFITENAELRLNYKTNENNIVDITRNNLSSTMDQVNIKDLNYQHIQSNEGESRYIIDNSDNADLIGPYFYKGILDISSFKNKDMWKKVNGVAKSVYAESKVDSVIGSFFTSIINDDNNLNKIQAESDNTNTLLFRTLLSVTDNSTEGEVKEKTYDQWFLEELRIKSPELARAVIKANDAMMTGKKYNSFYKIPVLYSFLMQRAISWELGQDVINLIVDYFTNVCNFIQDILEFASLYNGNLLLSKDKQHTFDMVKFFQIGNPEYDINTSTAYFLNEIKTNYPNLVAMTYAYTQAENNISLAGGMIPFDSVSFDFLWESGIIDANDLYAIKEDLRGVYNTFSQLDIKDMVPIYVINNKNPEVKKIQLEEPDVSKWGDKLKTIKTTRSGQDLYFLLSAIGAKNNQYFSMAEGVLGSEIAIFVESGTIVSGGYLDRLQKSRRDVDLLPLFINLVKANEGKIKAYRIYLAFMLDSKTKSNVFANRKDDMSYDEFTRRLAYLITIVFGSASLVASSLRGVYTTSKNDGVGDSLQSGKVIQVDKNPIFGILDPVDTNHGDSVSVNVGDQIDRGNLHRYDGDINSVRSDFLNPNVASGGITSREYWLQIDSLTREIINQGTSEIEWIVNDGLTSSSVRRNSTSSTIINPIDNVQISQASSFADEADLISLHSSSSSSDVNHKVSPEFNKTKKNWWSGYTSKFEKIKKNILTVLDHALEIFAATLSILELAFFFYDLFKETYTQNFYQYTTADGTSFYWNGGLSVSKYFGFVNYEISNISQMELIDPVVITLPQVEEYYYYNGIKYYDSSELKRRILLNYINGNDSPRNPKFNKYFALIGNEDATSKTIEELTQKVIKSLNITMNQNGSFDISKLNKESPYIQTLSASYDYGYVIPDSDNNVTLIQNIVDNIRPAYFVKLPSVNSNNIAQGQAGEITKLPGKYWDGMKVVDNGEVPDVLFDNSANDLKEGIKDQNIWNSENFKESVYTTASYQSLQKLYETFKTKFNIASKEILNIANTSGKYNQLPSGVTIQNLYEVKDARTNRIYTFYDINKASSFISENVKFNKIIDSSEIKIEFEGKYFSSKNELFDWVHRNMTSL
ncbi:hypothetical protein [Malacoplasma iowae]|uniref:hypothetical protein n=1 Tax=Malacoplasma iowae TaxID=2116 RepID=UPI003872D962|nr:hypothetical protein QX181_04225 [Malacoplasma iowae]